MYYTFPKVVSKIKKTLKKLDLVPLGQEPEDFIEKKLRFYYTVCLTRKKEKVFFKTLLKRERAIKNRFLNEINFLKTADRHPEHSLYPLTPRLVSHSASPSFPYLLYKFLPGKGKKREDRFSESELKKIAKTAKTINSAKNIFNLTRPRLSFSFYSYKKNRLAMLEKISLDFNLKSKIIKFIGKNRLVFSEAKPSLTHGDFSEANLIFSKQTVKVIDWEHVNLRNPLYDFASFWSKRKCQPKEQQKFKEYYQKEINIPESLFAPLFKLALLDISLQDILFFESLVKNIGKEKKDKIEKKALKQSREKEIKDTLALLIKEVL